MPLPKKRQPFPLSLGHRKDIDAWSDVFLKKVPAQLKQRDATIVMNSSKM